MALRIIGRKVDGRGANTHYKLSDDTLVTRVEGVKMCKKGELSDYHIYTLNGKRYLRDNPDTSQKDNIDEQPII